LASIVGNGVTRMARPTTDLIGIGPSAANGGHAFVGVSNASAMFEQLGDPELSSRRSTAEGGQRHRCRAPPAPSTTGSARRALLPAVGHVGSVGGLHEGMPRMKSSSCTSTPLWAMPRRRRAGYATAPAIGATSGSTTTNPRSADQVAQAGDVEFVDRATVGADRCRQRVRSRVGADRDVEQQRRVGDRGGGTELTAFCA
jgi:hypothetical protein